MKTRALWYDDKTNKQLVEDLEDTEAHEALYNLTEDILCLKEDVAESEQKRVNLTNHIKGQKLWINLLRKEIAELKQRREISIKKYRNLNLGLGDIALAWNDLEDELRKSEQLNKLGQAIFDAPA